MGGCFLMNKKEIKFNELKEFDKQYNIDFLCGIDEAGRGCMAGPIYAGCVILPKEYEFMELNDSKKIPEGKRYEIADKIKEVALAWGVGIVSNEEIDEIGIQRANFLAFERSIEDMTTKSQKSPQLILIDGNYTGVNMENHMTVVKGDGKSASIAAASIIAKTERDKFVIDVCHKEYPVYDFDKHKGYGTEVHRENIKKYGICKYHRKSFCSNYI